MNLAAECGPVSYTCRIADPKVDVALSPYYESLLAARRVIFKAVLDVGLPDTKVRELKKSHPALSGLLDFAFENLLWSAKDAQKTWERTLAYRIKTTTRRIKDLKEKIQRQQRPDRQVSFTRSLQKSEKRLRELQWSKTQPPWRGKPYPYKHEIRFDGRKREPFGNSGCRWDGRRLILKAPFKGGAPIVIEGVVFADKLTGKKPYLDGTPRRVKIFPRNDAVDKPLSWRLTKREGEWFATVSLLPEQAVPFPEETDAFRKGAVGLDLNMGSYFPFWAAVSVSADGNLEKKYPPFYFLPRETPGDKNEYDIWMTVKKVVALARRSGKAIVFEDLDFEEERAYLKRYEKIFRKNMSAWAYAKILEFLLRECYREGVYLCPVSPRYTSQIAKKKYASGFQLEGHWAAAYVIARRAMSGWERLGAKGGSVVDGNTKESTPRERFSRWKKISLKSAA